MLGGEDLMMMMKGDDDNNNNNMFYEDVFGTIEDFLDFSNEEVEFLLEPQEEQQLLAFEDHHPPLPPPPPADVAPPTDNNTFQCEDIDVAQLEWLSNFVEESFSPTTTIHVDSNRDSSNSNLTDDKKNVDLLHYRTPSPVSVLQDNNVVNINNGQRQSPVSSSSSSCSSLSTGTNLLAPMSPPETANHSLHAPRTKRPRPASVPRSHPLFDDNYTINSNSNSLLLVPPVTTDEAQLLLQPETKKAKKLKIVSSASAVATHDENSQANVRKCMHCEITKTPQWRAGPMGPKTLCNACGVRYKSGRLFPEYRPAASPTFVASQHSNSHKKVIEMRVKSTKEEMVAAAVPVSVKGCELINYIRSN